MTPGAQDDRDARLRAEALRVYRRYAIEIVEALGFCPWAEKARRDGAVREVVLLPSVADAAVDAALSAMDAIADEPTIEIGLLIFPRLPLDRLAFERLVGRVRERDAARRAPSPIPLAMAAFHPEAEADLSAPARLTPFVRRTPDPTIQLVRQATLDAVRRNEQAGTAFFDASKLAALSAEDLEALLAPPPAPLHERVSRQNLETVQRSGVAAIERILADIRADRDRSYAAIGEDIGEGLGPGRDED
jgi:hypothetical protein